MVSVGPDLWLGTDPASFIFLIQVISNDDLCRHHDYG
jgi:hypothetical protein